MNPVDSVRRFPQTESSRELERLAFLQFRASTNYFRLLEANRRLDARTKPAPQTTGQLLADSLEAERRRLGRELHTSVGQALAGIHVHMNLLEAELSDLPESVRESLRRIRALADAALDQVRGVSRRLYVPAWQAYPLTDALRNLWQTSGIPEKFAGTVNLRTLTAEPPPDVRRAIYLAAQEGLSNAIHHSGARHVCMSLSEHGGRIVLEIADDGSGFRGIPGNSESGRPEGIGLRSMRDLAYELGGEFQAQSTPEGARLTISFPVSHE